MLFRGKVKFNIFLLLCALIQLGAIAFAQSNKMDEIDLIRADLACQKNKYSENYVKLKQKLGKLIIQNKINYTTYARLKDVDRLIKEQKFNSAIYELNDLIENGIEVSKCNEILADICLKTSKNAASAAKYYRNSLEADNTNVSTEVKLIKLYFSENKNTLGIENLKRLVEKTNSTSLLEELEDLIQNNVRPNDRLEANNLYEILGRIYTKLNKKAESYNAYDMALQLNPGDIYLKYHFGDLLFENNQNNGALILYDSILNENPYESQIRTSKAKTLIKDGNLLSANKEFLTILEQYPDSNQAKYGIFKIYENKLPADKILEKINETNPNYSPTKEDFIEFAKFLEELNDYKGANIFKAYLKNYERNTQKALEQKNIEKKQPQKEKPQKQPIKNKKPQPQQVEQKKKQIVKELSKYQEYQQMLEQYLNIENKDASVYVAIANTYKLMNEPMKAVEYYKEALKLAPNNSDLNYILGLTYMELNSFKTSKTYLEKAISLDKENSKAVNLLAFVNQKIITTVINNAFTSFENKDYVEAFETLNSGIKEYPNNAQMYYYRALVCDGMGRNAAQIIDLQKAIELDPSYYMSYYQLGLAYEKVRDERSALVAYERFLSVEPDEKELVEEVQKKVLELGKKYY